MTKLESILGRDVLKSGDFKIGADGSVTSGKPLTHLFFAHACARC